MHRAFPAESLIGKAISQRGHARSKSVPSLACHRSDFSNGPTIKLDMVQEGIHHEGACPDHVVDGHHSYS